MKEININFDSKTNIELLHECGEREDVAMSQHAVTKELDKLRQKIDDLGQKIDDGEIPEVDTSALILEKEGKKITIDPTGNHGTLSTPSIRSHGEEAPGLGMVERHGFVLQEDFIGLVSRNGDKVGIFWNGNNGIYHSYFIGVDRGNERFGFDIHGQGGDNGVAVPQGKLWVNDTLDPTDIDVGVAASVGYVDRAVPDSDKILNTLATLGVLESKLIGLAQGIGDIRFDREIRVFASASSSPMQTPVRMIPEFAKDLTIVPVEYDGQYICEAILDVYTECLIPLYSEKLEDLIVDLPEIGECLLMSQYRYSSVNFFTVHFIAGDEDELEYDFQVPFEEGMTWLAWTKSIYPRLKEYGLAEYFVNMRFDKSSSKVEIGFEYDGWSNPTVLTKDMNEMVVCDYIDGGSWA